MISVKGVKLNRVIDDVSNVRYAGDIAVRQTAAVAGRKRTAVISHYLLPASLFREVKWLCIRFIMIRIESFESVSNFPICLNVSVRFILSSLDRTI